MNVHDIAKLSKKLISVKNKIYEKQNDYKIWCSLWFDMVGALYSFYKVFPLLKGKPREHSEMIADAVNILKLINLNEKIKDRNHDAWFDGHYLNNAEFRISLAFHCLLKTCYPCNMSHEKDRVSVPCLVYKICINTPIRDYDKKCFKRECNAKEISGKRCLQTPIPLNQVCQKILKDFWYYHENQINNRNPNPKTTGQYLVEIHFRVNSLKHTPDPVDDLMQTRERMEQAWEGLLGIYDLFRYIAKRRGAFKRP